MRQRVTFLAIGIAAAVTTSFVVPSNASSTASQAWPPFVLVVGLLAIGAIAHESGIFDVAGHRLGRLRGSPTVLLCSVLAVVALVTVVLNLDTAAAFLTPVAVAAARRRGLREESFLYGTLFMVNAASLLLPGSNLTNLLVLGQEHVSGAAFATRMWPAWAAAVLTTAAVVVVWRRRDLRMEPYIPDAEPVPSVSWSAVGLIAVVAAVVMTSPDPALPVLALAAASAVVAVGTGRVPFDRIIGAIDPAVILGLFGITVALGSVARSWSAPARLLESANAATTMIVAAGAAVLINNLPSAVLFTAHSVPHPRALLLGLNLGPNLAVTGSLSAFVWLKAARSVGAQADWRKVTRVGLLLVPLSLMAAALALKALAPTGL